MLDRFAIHEIGQYALMRITTKSRAHSLSLNRPYSQ